MVIEWRERQYGEADNEVMDDPEAQEALWRCRFYKFFHCNRIRAQRRLLETLINYWELEADALMIGGKSLSIETEDIYFLMGIPRWGDVVKLKGKWSINYVLPTFRQLCFPIYVPHVSSPLYLSPALHFCSTWSCPYGGFTKSISLCIISISDCIIHPLQWCFFLSWNGLPICVVGWFV